jgi:cell division protein FtsB
MKPIARRQRRVERLHRVNRLLTFAVIVVMLGALGISFIPILNKTRELQETLRQKKQELQTEILLQKKRARELRLLKADPVYLETIARDKLDLMKPGETIFRLDNKNSNKNPNKTPGAK